MIIELKIKNKTNMLFVTAELYQPQLDEFCK